MGKGRLTLSKIVEYPTPEKLYSELMSSAGWPYKTERERYLMRDRALVALLYLGDFRISEVLPLKKSQFSIKSDYVLVSGVQVGKRKAGKIEFREARLPLVGPRKCFTELVLKYLRLLKEDERLFPWSLRKVKIPIKGSFYRLKDGTLKQRVSVQMVGTKRAWQVVKALLPNYTQHWLRAFGYDFDYEHMQHDILAVSDKTKADPRSLQPYLRKRYEKYPVR